MKNKESNTFSRRISLFLLMNNFSQVRFCLLCIFLMSAVRLIGGNPVISKVSAYKTTIFSQIVPRCQNIPDTIVIVAPCPETNMYQTVSSLRVSPELPLRSLPLDGGKYLYWEQNGACEPLLRRFNVTVYAIKTDFSKIKRVDKPTQKHRCFIQNTGAYIVADDPRIRKIEKQLSRKSTNILDYARMAFLYTTSHYKYLNPNTGLHPLAEILDAGGGDCGNLSSIFISLLRAKGIPARHVVGMRFDQSTHVWAEFFLDGVGWIPADVTADLGTQSLAHFGNINDKCVVLHRGILFNLPNGRTNVDVPMLQNYSYWYWSQRDIGEVTIDFSFTSKQK